MGIYPLKNSKTWLHWNREEEEILRKNWRAKSIEEIKQMLPNRRTLDSIYTKAYKMGITKWQLKVNKLTQFEKGWIAALVDGEGTITLHRKKLKNGDIGYHPRLMIGNTNKDLMEKTKQIVGSGHISCIKTSSKLKPLWTYELSSIPLGKLLPQITDFLIVKKRRAEVVFDVIKINHTFVGGKRKFMTSKESHKLKELNGSVVKLNYK